MTDTSLVSRIQQLITRMSGDAAFPRERDALLLELAKAQCESIESYKRLVDARDDVEAALPVDVFRYARIAAHPESSDVRVFRTSGTTSGQRGAHHFRDLSTYKLAARTAAKIALFPDTDSIQLVILAPHEAEARDSSLSFMLSRFEEWFASKATWCWKDGTLDVALLTETLASAKQPVALLGTSFAFVHAEDALEEAGRSFALPKDSRIMQTGGFKGKSREIDPASMLSMLSARYGVPEMMIIAEYGMTELSSQMYETTLMDSLNGVERSRQLWVPGWVRVSVRDPVSLNPIDGRGILRIDDLANIDSVAMLQTADLAEQLSAQHLRLFGRAKGAMPRGCSLAVEEAIAKSQGT